VPGCARVASTAAPPRSVMNSRRLIASLKAQDKAPFRLSLAHRTKLQSGHSNSAGREILHPLMNGHEQALPDEAGPASCTTRFTKQFKRLVNFLNLRKKTSNNPAGTLLVQGD
ncbi:MAG: hypothetical protein WA662_04485, partial [Pseudolabrys sp.]